MAVILASHWSIVMPLLKDMRTHRRKNEQTGGDRDTMTTYIIFRMSKLLMSKNKTKNIFKACIDIQHKPRELKES